MGSVLDTKPSKLCSYRTAVSDLPTFKKLLSAVRGIYGTDTSNVSGNIGVFLQIISLRQSSQNVLLQNHQT